MPAPMNVKAFNEMQLKIADAYIKVSKTSMTDAAEEIHQDNIQEGDSEYFVANITVSCDGKWQKRGHSSLNGVMTVIATDTGKFLDYRVLSKYCRRVGRGGLLGLQPPPPNFLLSKNVLKEILLTLQFLNKELNSFHSYSKLTSIRFIINTTAVCTKH